jgi:hypothetical protein
MCYIFVLLIKEIASIDYSNTIKKNPNEIFTENNR